MGSNAELRIKDLSKKFGDLTAVDDLSLEVEKGDLIALLGPSGCGKSTTLRSICGLEELTTGTIQIGDQLVASAKDELHLPPYERNVGMMFQSNALWPHMNVRENILYPLKQKEGVNAAEKEHRVDELLEMVNLPGVKTKAVTDLSGGQQQRVALARALIHNPDVLLMDEPLSSLDARLQREMRADIKALQEQENFTVIYVTHDQKEALYLADQVCLMRNGELVEQGEPEEVYHHPKNPFAMEFLDPNDPLRGTIEEVHDDWVKVSIQGASTTLNVDTDTASLSEGDVCQLYIRPTDVSVATEEASTEASPQTITESQDKVLKANGHGSSDNVLQCTVDLCAFQGSVYEARFSVGDQSVLGEIKHKFDAGDTVGVRFPSEKIRLFLTGGEYV